MATAWLLAGAAHAQPDVAYKCGAAGRVTYSDRPCTGSRPVGATAPHHEDKWKVPPQDRATVARRALLPAATKQECRALDARLQEQETMLKTRGPGVTLQEEMPLVLSRKRYRELKC
jgi:hypothetical protein